MIELTGTSTSNGSKRRRCRCGCIVGVDVLITQTLCNTLKHEFMVQWDASSAFVAKNYNVTSWHEKLIAPVHPVLHQVCSYETIPNAPKHYETHENMSLGSNGVNQVCSFRKIQCDFVARNFVLIEPVQHVLKQVSCSYGTTPNAPKYYEMHRNISLGSNGVDWVHSLRKIST